MFAALTAESERCTATHRAKISSGRASCRRLFTSLFIFGGGGGIKKKMKGPPALTLTNLEPSLIACHNPPRCSATAPWELRREPDACSRRAALAEAPTGPGCGTVRLCRPPLQLLLSSTLRTCPSRIYFSPPTPPPPPSLPRKATEISPLTLPRLPPRRQPVHLK